MSDTPGADKAEPRPAAAPDRKARGETPAPSRNGPAVAPPAPAERAALVGRFRELRESLRTAGVEPFTTDEIVALIHAGRKS